MWQIVEYWKEHGLRTAAKAGEDAAAGGLPLSAVADGDEFEKDGQELVTPDADDPSASPPRKPAVALQLHSNMTIAAVERQSEVVTTLTPEDNELARALMTKEESSSDSESLTRDSRGKNSRANWKFRKKRERSEDGFGAEKRNNQGGVVTCLSKGWRKEESSRVREESAGNGMTTQNVTPPLPFAVTGAV
ncbi:unnamed protein product [Linum trigynum]